MAKGIGLIGNFKGKVGNTVGYKLTASNNGQTQGIRVYQPIVKNPKSAGQAEQRAKLLAVNATYRALMLVIDRGNEGLPYGNKSRLAWLKTALKAELMPWYEKGAMVAYPVGCTVAKGSLPTLNFTVGSDNIVISVPEMKSTTSVATEGAIATALKAAYPFLKDGDQVTFVIAGSKDGILAAGVESILIDTTSTRAVTGFSAQEDEMDFVQSNIGGAGAIIVSRQGDNGEHLRSTSLLVIEDSLSSSTPYNSTSKAAAIASYRASAATNSDWAEESIQ